MGYALAEAAKLLDFEVTLISGPVSISPPNDINLIKVVSAKEMDCEVRKFAKSADIIIMVAAVADYKPINISKGKIKKNSNNLILELERTEDILAKLGETKREEQVLIGFAAEYDNILENAKEKLIKKNLDWLVVNDISKANQGFKSDNNAVTILGRNNAQIDLPLQSKLSLAKEILYIILRDSQKDIV